MGEGAEGTQTFRSQAPRGGGRGVEFLVAWGGVEVALGRAAGRLGR